MSYRIEIKVTPNELYADPIHHYQSKSIYHRGDAEDIFDDITDTVEIGVRHIEKTIQKCQNCDSTTFQIVHTEYNNDTYCKCAECGEIQ